MSALEPPSRFATCSFANYQIEDRSHREALTAAHTFVETVQRRERRLNRMKRWLGLGGDETHGLYLVGPVGTGKTHLLAATYHALHPDVPCAFVHTGALFRSTEHPEAYARRLATSYRVLCLDELEIDDPANEARLVLLLTSLEELDVLLMATSNVEPHKFLSNQFGTHRFRRFLNETFRQNYRVVVVGGDDYRRRLDKPGRAWIGGREATRAAMKAVYHQDPRHKSWLPFDELMRLATEIEHTRLVDRLTERESLYVADVAPTSLDDALRLVRIMDDLYLSPDVPDFYFTATTPPDAWLRPEDARGGIERAVAEKFTRTSSRLHALCSIENV